MHGGAGTIARDKLTARREARYRASLERALKLGYAVLEAGGSSVDAVAAAVVALEDSPLFNAGRGAVLNAAGGHELDAAIMEGASLKAGAVAAVRRAKNPVLVARAVMERTPHVMLAGIGADAYARKVGLEIVPASYFTTRVRQAALARARMRAKGELALPETEAERHGTVGAVAVDWAGTVAAATSTGGMTGKLPGRVGDSPVIGAGTYADNRACAVSATGHGEFFIRSALAYDVVARMRYVGEPLELAATHALARTHAMGGGGGLIAIDINARIAMPFTSEGMYRGYLRGDELYVAVFGD